MTIKFSSPSGDGLVLKNEKNKCKNLKIFVPAWGWVGSSGLRYDSIVLCENFRPRLGMGWFLIYCFRTNCTQIFK